MNGRLFQQLSFQYMIRCVFTSKVQIQISILKPHFKNKLLPLHCNDQGWMIFDISAMKERLPTTIQSSLTLAILFHLNIYASALYGILCFLFILDKVNNFNFQTDIQRKAVFPVYGTFQVPIFLVISLYVRMIFHVSYFIRVSFHLSHST